MKPMHHLTRSVAYVESLLRLVVGAIVMSWPAPAQSVQGPSSSRPPYLQPTAANPGVVSNVTSIVTTLDHVPTTGALGAPYEVAGVLDGLGAYDNHDGTVTVLANHEINSASGAIRRHGQRGTFVAEFLIDQATLQVVSAQDLIAGVVDAAGILHNAANGNSIALHRFCSGDLPPVSAFYNSASGLGTQDRIFLCGEEGSSTGHAVATVATGPAKGLAYLLPAFNLATNGSGINAVGARENMLASPFEQDLTVVVSNNDGGTGAMTNTVNVYVGTKQGSGTAVERAGLKSGSNFLVSVVGNPIEIVNSATRQTNIVNGTRFSLHPTIGTTFSRPEDGAWDPGHPNDYYFVTTDRLDTLTSTGLNQTVGSTGTSQAGVSRLFRLRFDDITNPMLGGVIDILIQGAKNGQKVNMLDNLCVGSDGRIYLNEDPGSTTYLPKVWVYDPALDTLVQLFKVDESRWGELAVNGGTPGAISPQTDNKEISGVVDVTGLFPHAPGESVFLVDVQDHSTHPAVASASSVEGGQLLLFRVVLGARAEAYGAGCGLSLAAAPGSQPVLGSLFSAQVDGIPNGNPAFMMVGESNATFGPVPLPLPLDGLGLTGCLLHQDLSLQAFGSTTPVSGNAALYGLPIPASFSFTGLRVYLQGLAADMAANPYGAILSNGLSVTLGL